MKDPELTVSVPKSKSHKGLYFGMVIFIIVLIIVPIGIFIYKRINRPPTPPNGPPTPSACPTHSSFTGDISGFDMYSNKIPTYTGVPDLATCESYCDDNTTNPNCYWVNYSPGTKNCYLKTTPIKNTIDAGLKVSGNPTGLTCPTYSQLPPNHDIQGKDMKNSSGNYISTSSGITSEQDCQNMCSNTPGCNFYAYDTVGKVCYPKQADVETGAYADIVTGFKIN